MSCFKVILTLISIWRISSSSVGLVEFISSSEELVEGNFVHFVGVKRTNGSSGVVTCNISIITSPDVDDAREGEDYELLTTWVTFWDGDSDPKAVVLRFIDNAMREKEKFIRLSISSSPIEAAGQILQMTLKLVDDKDGGLIRMPRNTIRMEEELLFFPPPMHERCLLFAERIGGSSGRAEVLVRWYYTDHCAEDDQWPAITKDARHRVDWGDLDGIKASVSWDDGEDGVKCAVEKYWLRNFSSTNGSNASAVLIYSDGLVEVGEGFCGYLEAAEESAAEIIEGQLPFSVLIGDRGKNGGGELICIKGAECHLNLTLSIAVAFLNQRGNWTFVQAPGHGVTCLPCSIGANLTSYQNLSLHQVRVEGVRFEFAEATLGTALRNDPPGDRSICMCRVGDRDNDTHQIATLQLAGPERDNSAACLKSENLCAFELRGVPTGGRNHLRIMPSCEDVKLTPPGFVQGAMAVSDTWYYELEDTESMRIEDAGVYKLCWCHVGSQSDCSRLEDFNVEAGTFIYAGPYMVSSREARIFEELTVETSGIGLSSSDEAILMETCGNGTAVLSAGKIQGRFFRFGELSDDLLAGSYQLCWCQPGVWADTNCSTPQDFKVFFGSVRLRCPRNFAELESGHCERCRLLFEVPEANSVCQIHMPSLALVLLWFLLSTVLFMAILGSFRCRFRKGRWCPTLVGTPRPISDVSQTGGKLIVTTCGFHNLMKLPVPSLKTMPVTFTGTRHPLLDGQSFRVRVRDGRTLEVLDVTFRADSSMGQAEVSCGRALLHSALHGLKLPLLAQILILSAVCLGIGGYIDPPPGQGALVVCCGGLMTLILFLVYLQFVRTPSPLSHSLKIHASSIAEKGQTRATKSGPERALAVHDILDLWDNFQHLVRDRNMYYMDANIVRPLTAPNKLSYAELVGPQDAMWFVSHWWGTEFRVYCEALSRHAKAVKESNLDWKRTTTYWICTFANNQHKISAELGQFHEESSFYQALHNGTVRGTCMILDEKAMPLTRSWCLFEILQTINLRKQKISFQGLFFCTETGVLNRGNCTVEMSIQIGHRMASLSLADAEATTEKDKRMIHDLVVGEMQSFDHIDRVLKKSIGEALTECEKSVSRQFSELYEELDFVTEDSPQRRSHESLEVSPQPTTYESL